MVYIAHHKFLGTYTKQDKTIVIMNDEGELNIGDACDSPVTVTGTVITSKLFLELISDVCPHYLKTSETWFLQEQPPADVGGGKDVGGGGEGVGAVGGGGEETDVGGGGEGVDAVGVEGVGGRREKGGGGGGKDKRKIGVRRGKDVGGGGTDVGGKGKIVGGRGKGVESVLSMLTLSDLDKKVHSGLTLYAIISMFCSRLDPAAFELLIRKVVDEKAGDFFKNSNVILSSAITVSRKGEQR